METKYYFIEIEYMKDGSIPKAVTIKDTEDDAYSQYYQTMASCRVNDNCLGYDVYINDSDGHRIASEVYRKKEFKPLKERFIEVVTQRLDDGEDIRYILQTLAL